MRNYIWATDCPDCKSGIIALSEKGGIANCIVCGAEYHTDYEEHPELGTPETEYWLTDKVVPQPEIFTDEAIGDSGLDQFKQQGKSCRTCRFIDNDGREPCNTCGDGDYVNWQPLPSVPKERGDE